MYAPGRKAGFWNGDTREDFVESILWNRGGEHATPMPAILQQRQLLRN